MSDLTAATDTRSTNTRFLELVLDDEDLLRREFEAIIATQVA